MGVRAGWIALFTRLVCMDEVGCRAVDLVEGCLGWVWGLEWRQERGSGFI